MLKSMSDPAERLLRLLSLLQARRFWSGNALAERLEVTARTVRRDVERLRRLGYPVDASVGVAGGYQLGTGASLPPLLLDDAEALAVALGLRTAAAGGVAGIEEALVRALAKLEQVMPARLRERVQALGGAVASLYFGGPTVDAQVLSALAVAHRGHFTVGFGYCDAQGNERQRQAEPHGLVHTGTRWYLIAWDLDRTDWRTFRVDRIVSAVTPGQGFLPRPIPHGSAAEYVAHTVRHHPEAVAATVVFDAPPEVIEARVPRGVATLEACGDGRCLLRTSALRPARLATDLAGIGVDFEVLEPPELIDAVRVLAKRLNRAVKASGASGVRRPSASPNVALGAGARKGGRKRPLRPKRQPT